MNSGIIEGNISAGKSTLSKEIGDKYVYFWENFDPPFMRKVYEEGINEFDEVKKELALNYSWNFTWKKNAEEYSQLYKSLLEK